MVAGWLHGPIGAQDELCLQARTCMHYCGGTAEHMMVATALQPMQCTGATSLLPAASSGVPVPVCRCRTSGC